MRLRTLLIFAGLLLGSCLAGCGDDDEELIPTPDQGAATAEGDAVGQTGEPGDATSDADDGGATDPEDGGATGGSTTAGDTATDTPDDGKKEGASLWVNPGLVNFGSTQIGETKAAQFVLQNNGTEKLNILNTVFETGGDKGFAFNEDPPSGLIVPGEKITLDLKFTTAKVGSATATIKFITQPTLAEPVTVFLKAIAVVQGASVAQEIVPSLPSVKFGPTVVGENQNLEVRLANTSTDPIQVTGLEWLDGAGPFGYSTDKNIPALLGPTSEVKVAVSYTPGGGGVHEAVLRVHTDSAFTPLLLVPVSGTGYSGNCKGKLTCNPGNIDFGGAWTGRVAGRSIVCRNTGNGPLTVTQMTADLPAADGLGWTEPDLPVTLQKGEGVGTVVTYQPANLVDGAAGSVTVESDACDNGTVTIAVTGSGAEAPAAPACPAPKAYTAKTLWEWTAESGHGRVHMTPLVVNLDDDDGDGDIDGQDIPEVVFTAHDNPLPEVNDDAAGTLRAVRGKDGSVLWTSPADEKPSWAGNLAAGELDGKAGPEIVGIAYGKSPGGEKCPGVSPLLPAAFCGKYLSGHLLAFHGVDGSLMWKSEPFTGAMTDLANLSAPVIADLDQDGSPEVVLGNHVFDGLTGRLEWVGAAGRGNSGHGYAAHVVDVDGNGTLDVVAGNTAYNFNGTILWTATTQDSHATAAADLDQDGDIEVLVSAPNGNTVIIDGKTGSVVVGPEPTGIIGCCASAPAIADIVGGSPGLEIVLVADDQIKVYDNDLQLIWSRFVDDPSGGAGAAVFDLQGDGAAEVLYADAKTLFAFRGVDGKPVLDTPRLSETGLELPVVADVNGDGRADVLTAVETKPGEPGLRLITDQEGEWVRTGRIWNQHAYSPATVYASGAIPMTPGPSAPVVRGNLPECK